MNNTDFWCALDELVATSEIVIDRPGGTAHPRYPDYIYPLDYGYLKNTASMDGGGIDVWLGSAGDRHVNGVICTVDLMKRDSEIKVLIDCTPQEQKTALESHNETRFMKGILIRRD